MNKGKCLWCKKPATNKTERDDNLYCDKCWREGEETEREAMGYYEI